jgi:TrpR-related protein YerC/YecD
MTEKEMLEFSRRFEVAKMLDQGISYARIEKKTGMSSTTIARISKALK